MEPGNTYTVSNNGRVGNQHNCCAFITILDYLSTLANITHKNDVGGGNYELSYIPPKFEDRGHYASYIKDFKEYLTDLSKFKLMTCLLMQEISFAERFNYAELDRIVSSQQFEINFNLKVTEVDIATSKVKVYSFERGTTDFLFKAFNMKILPGIMNENIFNELCNKFLVLYCILGYEMYSKRDNSGDKAIASKLLYQYNTSNKFVSDVSLPTTTPDTFGESIVGVLSNPYIALNTRIDLLYKVIYLYTSRSDKIYDNPIYTARTNTIRALFTRDLSKPDFKKNLCITLYISLYTILMDDICRKYAEQSQPLRASGVNDVNRTMVNYVNLTSIGGRVNIPHAELFYTSMISVWPNLILKTSALFPNNNLNSLFSFNNEIYSLAILQDGTNGDDSFILNFESMNNIFGDFVQTGRFDQEVDITEDTFNTVLVPGRLANKEISVYNIRELIQLINTKLKYLKINVSILPVEHQPHLHLLFDTPKMNGLLYLFRSYHPIRMLPIPLVSVLKTDFEVNMTINFNSHHYELQLPLSNKLYGKYPHGYTSENLSQLFHVSPINHSRVRSRNQLSDDRARLIVATSVTIVTIAIVSALIFS